MHFVRSFDNLNFKVRNADIPIKSAKPDDDIPRWFEAHERHAFGIVWTLRELTSLSTGDKVKTGFHSEDALKRIGEALEAASDALKPFVPGAVKVDYKSGDDPVTEADRAVNRVLHETLLRDGEGWLSEESVDDRSRLGRNRIWIVDPLDGTREFVSGIPEWCVSIAFVEYGRATAAGITNPATGETFLGCLTRGVTYNGQSAQASHRQSLAGAVVLASRREVKRGEWKRFEKAPFLLHPMGSVAYKLARVAAGLADATWTLTPKHEWDVAAGVSLVEAAGGFVRTLADRQPHFNNESALLPGLIAGGAELRADISSFLGPYLQAEAVSAPPDH